MESQLRSRLERDLRIKGRCPQTVKSYVRVIELFLEHCGPKFNISKLNLEMVLNYQHYLLETRKLAPTTVNVNMAAIRFFMTKTLGIKLAEGAIPWVKKKRKVPVILSIDEVAALVNSIENLKHRTLILTIYAAGLRSNESVHLKAEDIHSDRMLVHVAHGKGGKTRYTLLPPVLLQALRFYWKNWPEDKKQWLFPGDDQGHISNTKARRIFREAKKKIGLQKQVTLHSLRHAFATHLLEMGVDLRYIQVLLGHARISTSTIYSQVRESQFRELMSPLEVLGKKLTWLPTAPPQKGTGKAA
jgi:integrase/recombinase XerD